MIQELAMLERPDEVRRDSPNYIHEWWTKMERQCAKGFFKLFGSREVRLLMLGLDNAGKSTILARMQARKPASTVPTVGFNIETVTVRNVRFNVWDVGGQQKIRQLWRHYYRGVQGLIYVVDSACPERFAEAKQELHAVLDAPEMDGAQLLVLANKQDLASALSGDEIAEAMQLSTLRGRSMCVLESNGITGEALVDGLVWLSQNIAKTK